MKNLLALIIIISCSTNLSAQKKYSYSAKIGTVSAINTPKITPFTMEVTTHYALTRHWAVGLGSGFAQYDNISIIPLYANIQYIINPKAENRFFADCAIGHSFAFGKKRRGGYLLNPEFGVQKRVLKKTFILAIGYKLQNIERVKSHSDNYVSSEFTEKLCSQGISAKIGLVF